jgi:hypothetical protein
MAVNATLRKLWLDVLSYFTKLVQLNGLFRRSRWPRTLRRGSGAVCLLGLRVQISPAAVMSVYCECRMFSGTRFCDGPIPRPEESYWVWCVWVWSQNLNYEEDWAHEDCQVMKQNGLYIYLLGLIGVSDHRAYIVRRVNYHSLPAQNQISASQISLLLQLDLSRLSSGQSHENFEISHAYTSMGLCTHQSARNCNSKKLVIGLSGFHVSSSCLSEVYSVPQVASVLVWTAVTDSFLCYLMTFLQPQFSCIASKGVWNSHECVLQIVTEISCLIVSTLTNKWDLCAF